MLKWIKRLILQAQRVVNPVGEQRRKSLVRVVVKQASHAIIEVNMDMLRISDGISFLIRPLHGSVRKVVRSQ